MTTRRRGMAGAAEDIREPGAAGTTPDDIRARTTTRRSRLVHCLPEMPPTVPAREAEPALEATRPPPDPGRRSARPHPPGQENTDMAGARRLR
ncbi:hypothetical protein [Streptomyces olivaceoviridis]